jgi:hypothetical protein
MPAAKNNLVVAAGKKRSFRCVRGCYWNNTRYRSAEEAKEADVIEFASVDVQTAGEIPADFQFDNWEEI